MNNDNLFARKLPLIRLDIRLYKIVLTIDGPVARQQQLLIENVDWKTGTPPAVI